MTLSADAEVELQEPEQVHRVSHSRGSIEGRSNGNILWIILVIVLAFTAIFFSAEIEPLSTEELTSDANIPVHTDTTPTARSKQTLFDSEPPLAQPSTLSESNGKALSKKDTSVARKSADQAEQLREGGADKAKQMREGNADSEPPLAQPSTLSESKGKALSKKDTSGARKSADQAEQMREGKAPKNGNANARKTVSGRESSATAKAHEIVDQRDSLASIETQEYWRLDPAVNKDPYIRSFPNEQSASVKNAKFMANLLRKHFTFDGFEVKRDGKHVGFMPVMYMGFPKHGTSSSFALMTRMMPCRIDRDESEPHFWTRMWRPTCELDGPLLQSCVEEGEKGVVARFLQYLRGGDRKSMLHVSDEKEMLAEGRCDPPFWIDGSTPTLWERHLFGVFQGKKQVPFETLVLVKELTPRARFLLLARTWDVSLVRSSWWFFKKNGNGDAYKRDLGKHQQQLERVAEDDSACESLFLRDFARPRINAWADSCKLAAILKLFDASRVFVTEVGPFMRCETHFFRWFAAGLAQDLALPAGRLADYGSTCDASRVEGKKTSAAGGAMVNVHDHTKEDEEITPAIERMEERLVSFAVAELWPLLPVPAAHVAPADPSGSDSDSDR